ANLVGHVTWAGSPQPNTRQMQPLTLTLCSTSAGSTTSVIAIATTSASGTFTMDVASLIGGTYNWREKGSRSLANGGTLTLTAGGGNQQAEMGVQKGGDADNDNVVGVADFSILRATFNTGSDLRADFNNDGVTNAQDFSILRSSFGQGGAAVACP
ncbi:MAG: dockerin type I domain-containing protein, partial [Chloroflexia bacterium]